MKKKKITAKQLNVPIGNTNIVFHTFGLNVCVIPGSIRPVKFGPAGTVRAEISIRALTYIKMRAQKNTFFLQVGQYGRGQFKHQGEFR